MEVHVAAPSNKTSLALVNSNDLVVDILSRLPVKSLMRFKCVHKSWHVLIDEDNYFKTMHLHKFTFNENNARILLKQQIENPSKDVLHMLSDEEAHESVARLDMPSIFQIEEFPYGINHPYLCSVNGIICISNCKRAGLWNPAIREFRLLPDFQQPDVKDYNYNGYGIGYDCIRDDYKVIRTVDCYTENGYYLEDEESTYTPGSPMFFQPPEKLFFEVYSLKTDSWRKVNVDSEPFIIASYTLPNHVYLKGACHWLSCQTNDHDGVLLSFDMTEEVFQKTDLPDRVRSDGPIVNLKGSIAFINEDFRESKCFYIWILGEVGLKESWKKLFTLGPFPEDLRYLIGVGKNYEFFIIKKDKEVAWCDSGSPMHLKNLGIRTYYSYAMVTIIEKAWFLLVVRINFFFSTNLENKLSACLDLDIRIQK